MFHLERHESFESSQEKCWKDFKATDLGIERVKLGKTFIPN